MVFFYRFNRLSFWDENSHYGFDFCEGFWMLDQGFDPFLRDKKAQSSKQTKHLGSRQIVFFALLLMSGLDFLAIFVDKVWWF